MTLEFFNKKTAPKKVFIFCMLFHYDKKLRLIPTWMHLNICMGALWKPECALLCPTPWPVGGGTREKACFWLWVHSKKSAAKKFFIFAQETFHIVVASMEYISWALNFLVLVPMIGAFRGALWKKGLNFSPNFSVFGWFQCQLAPVLLNYTGWCVIEMNVLEEGFILICYTCGWVKYMSGPCGLTKYSAPSEKWHFHGTKERPLELLV